MVRTPSISACDVVRRRALGLFDELREQHLGIDAQNLGDLDEFDHIDATLASFDAADERMWTAQARGEIEGSSTWMLPNCESTHI